MNPSHEQCAFLEGAKRAEFEAKLADFLRREFPPATGSLTDEQLAVEVHALVRRAQQFGISSEASVAQWSCLTRSLGPDFHAIPAIDAYFMASGGQPEHSLRALLNVTLQLCSDPNSAPAADPRVDALRHLAACGLLTALAPAARSGFARALRSALVNFSPAIDGARALPVAPGSIHPDTEAPAGVTYSQGNRQVRPLIDAIAESLVEWQQAPMFDAELAVAAAACVINAAKAKVPWVPATVGIAGGIAAGRVWDAMNDRFRLTGKLAENLAAMRNGASAWLKPGSGLAHSADAQFRTVRPYSAVDDPFVVQPAAFPIARAYAARGRFVAAIQCCKNLLQQAPKDESNVLMLAGDCFLALGSVKAAERLYVQARAINESSALALAVLSQVHGLGGARDPENEMRAAVNLAPGEPYAYVVAGNLLLSGNNPAKAIEYYKYALKLDSRFVPAYAPLMAAFMANGSVNDASKVAQLILQRAPDDVPCLLVIGQIHEMEGQFEEAAENAARAVGLAPESFRCHLALARAEIAWKHDLMKAEFHLRLALRLASAGKVQDEVRRLHTELTDYLSMEPM